MSTSGGRARGRVIHRRTEVGRTRWDVPGYIEFDCTQTDVPRDTPSVGTRVTRSTDIGTNANGMNIEWLLLLLFANT